MASSSKRLTRKDLRQPDWFQTSGEAALDFYKKKRSQVWIAAGGLFLVLIVVIGWRIFQANHNIEAGKQFGFATALYQEGKYRAAVSEFQKAQAYRWSNYASIAHLYEANSHLALNDLDAAVTAAQRFVAATKPNSLYRQLGLFTLGSAEERKQQYKPAVEHYSQAETINGPVKSLAALGKARCSEKLGDYQAALSAYKEYLKSNPGSWVSMQIQELEAKVARQPAKK